MPADDRKYDKDVLGANANAKDDSERKLVLDAALEDWGTRWVGKIQRIEPNPGSHYYALWHHPQGVDNKEVP